MSKKPRVAIVHDWLVGGGAERVVEALHQLYPDAPIYTSYCSDEWRKRLDNRVVTGYLQSWPFSKLRKFLPVLRVWWFTRLNFDNYDLVISSSGAEAKGIRTGEHTLHVNYCHAPTHYYWSRYDQYIENPGFGIFDSIARIGLKLLVGPLRRWDYKAAQRPDYIIANSTHIQAQIQQYYHRDSVVIFPPVDIARFRPDKDYARRGFVTAGRQTPYKRFDLAVRACSELNLPLTIIGSGPHHQYLQKIAGPSVTFVADATDGEVTEYFKTAEAFIFPGLDDFGITPVEAMAAGTPVIAFKAGGALDYVTPKSGIFFTKQTTNSLKSALRDFSSTSFNHTEVAATAQRFDANQFKASFRQYITDIR